jgi:integrase
MGTKSKNLTHEDAAMPKRTLPLSDKQVLNAKVESGRKISTLFDGSGLFLEIRADGTKCWRMKYRFGNKESRLYFGTYPAVSLKEARDFRDKAKKLLINGVNPGAVKEEERKSTKAKQKEHEAELERNAETFAKAAWAWFEDWRKDKAPSNVSKILGRLEKDILPWLGDKPLMDVTPHDVYATCARIQERGALETGNRVLGYLDAIFKYVLTEDAKDESIAKGEKSPRLTINPCANLRGHNVTLLKRSPPKRHYAHFAERTGEVSTAKFAEYLRGVEGFKGSLVVFSALRLAPLLFCRPGELRKARWRDINLEQAEWVFQVSKKKPGEKERYLYVPLSRQACAILKDLFPLTGSSEFVFTGARTPKTPMSDAAVNAAIRRMGFDTQQDVSGHGFRHIAASLLRELGFPDSHVEESLSHKVNKGVAGEYDHAKYQEQRRVMMQAWGDYLDKLKAGAEVIPLYGGQAA